MPTLYSPTDAGNLSFVALASSRSSSMGDPSAASHRDTEIVLMTDPDAVATPTWAEALVEAAEAAITSPYLRRRLTQSGTYPITAHSHKIQVRMTNGRRRSEPR